MYPSNCDGNAGKFGRRTHTIQITKTSEISSCVVIQKWNISYLREKNVYEPAEDTFLLLDALEDDIQNLTSSKPGVVVEIGPGSGIVITAISNVLKKNAYYLAVDINPDACLLTKNTAELNGVKVIIV